MKKQDVPTKINCETGKVKALVANTVAECRQQGFSIQEMADFLTQIQIALMRREDELRKELF